MHPFADPGGNGLALRQRAGAARDLQAADRHGNHDGHERQRRQHFRQRKARRGARFVAIAF